MLLATVFLLKCGDPTALGETYDKEGALPFYASWHQFLATLYMVSDWLCLPLNLIYNGLHALVPSIETEWFPKLPTNVIAKELERYLTAHPETPLPTAWLEAVRNGSFEKVTAGAFCWIPFAMIFVFAALSKLMVPVEEFMRNFVWNLFIEFSFTQKKQQQYQDALEKRTEALAKLYSENRNLSQETDVLKTSVITDEMTQVYNKRFFVQKMTEEFERAKKNKTVLSLVMMDIDHFKKFNDTYGHLLGDKVLIKVAEVAKKMTPQGCFCCRYGGEEFGVIMPGKSFEEALQISDNIRTNVPLIRLEEDASIQIHISQGLIVLNFQGNEAMSLEQFTQVVKLADDELYRAKEEGRNRVCYKRMDRQDSLF